MDAGRMEEGACRKGWRAGWVVAALGIQPVYSPVGEAVGCRHYPTGVDKTPSTEAIPNVDGGQPGV